jgi:peptidoglycan/xylan/chitin deacetylase (PgdA/CDA1 family)
MIRLLSLLFHDVYEKHPSESGFPGPAANRYKLSVAAFQRQLVGLASVREDVPLLVDEETLPLAESGTFAITVDDGGVSFYTHVADRLEALGWRAHCFVPTGCIGRKEFLDRSQIRDLHRRGHGVGSHSVSHPARFASLSREAMAREWTDSRNALRDILGRDVTVASVPGGHYAPRVAAAVSEAGFRVLFTSEPETRVRIVDGCHVIGRFAVRRKCRPDFSARLGRLQRSALLREWVGWNGKKVARGILGASYPRLTARMSSSA